MISSEIFSSIILIGLILTIGSIGLQLYVSHYVFTLVSLEIESVKSFFRDLVNGLNMLNPVTYTFSLRYGILIISVDGFQFLNFANETIFSSYFMILKYVSQYKIYPSRNVIIESGNSTYFSFYIVGCENQLILYLYPLLSIDMDKVIVGAVVFNINNSLKIVSGKYIFNPSIIFINRFYRITMPINMYLHYHFHSYNFVFNAEKFSHINLDFRLISIGISGG
ncbi:MAG: hypothetical protein QXS19_02790 [Candidatus Methanomethylicia archaeon]